ncbi:cytidylate kinase [Cadophora sp. MPI-SDFR-AT-0126]|nr:cytidylate kinase [Leotiomycetes sp. MPI-SDFR-AT-0126]
MDSSIMDSCLPFLHLVERLKNTPRAGWGKRGIQNPESVGDHMYRMAVICMLLPKDDTFDQSKCVRMALIHDIGEAIIGDITPSDGISREDKHRREALAVNYLSCLLKTSNLEAATEIKSLFDEYEAASTKEAKFVREIDAFECLLQAEEYEEREKRAPADHRLHEFLSLESRITSPDLSKWTKLLAQERIEIAFKRSSEIVIVFVIGGPGVGKGTQCSRIAAEFGFEHISVGDLLREEAKRPSSVYAEFINTSIRESVIIPAQLTCDLIKVKMNAAMQKGIKRFLIDGFPRSLDQATKFEEKIHEQNFTISLECPEDTMVKRLLERAKASGRIDDNAESITKRLRTFRDANKAIEDHLRKKGPFTTIQCDGTPDEVYDQVKPAVAAILSDVKRLSGS